MQNFYTTREMPEWVKTQIENGRTEIHNAPRPLFGDETNDSWDLDFIHGRHYAALDPSGPRFEEMADYNRRMDAFKIHYIDEEKARTVGLSWVQKNRTDLANELDMSDPDHRDWLLRKGLDLLNEGQG